MRIIYKVYFTYCAGIHEHRVHIQYCVYTIHMYEYNVQCTVGWSDFSFLWNIEKKQVGVVTFGKKNMFSLKKILINGFL